METHKTKELVKIFKNNLGENETALLVTTFDQDTNFMKAQNKVKNVKVVTANNLNVLDLLKHDKLYFCPKSLREVTQLLLAYSFESEKPKWVKNLEIEEFLNINYAEKDQVVYPELGEDEPLDLKFTFLKDYYERYLNSANKNSKSEIIENKE